MFAAEVILVIISLVAILFNLVTLYIVGVRLRLHGIDLVLMALVAVLDMLVSANSLARIIGIWASWLVVNNSPQWWCEWDSTVMLTLTQTSLETVAALGLLRYLAICQGRVVGWVTWACVVLVSFVSSMLLNLGFTGYESSFMWSKSGLVCLPFTIKGLPNHRYFTAWLGLLFTRFFAALFIIVFCYSNVTLSYRRLLSSSMASKHSSSQMFGSPVDPKLKRRRMHVTLQLVGIAFGYIVCMLPDIGIALCFLLDKTDISKYTMAFSHSLFAATAVVSPLFVLVAHDPSRRELKICLSRWSPRPAHPHSQRLETFPYRQY
ncbi:hypothetical protein DSO57_1020633 [Entomophthora muscae]|uniref:Uncharacterized protein n=1 Tax=Entomophthora muscae TaxID=34485 RepID=A0ACC2S5R6_9FUNG|nr:hypothetical protein DSO57_1020633 [Entomophthora muscae]